MTKLSLTDCGSGDPIVFLHGFCESKEYWDIIAEPLSGTNRVVCIDLPGFGKSLHTSELSIEDMAEEVAKALEKLEIGSFMLVGHSLGGYVSLALAENMPGFIKGLCLFHSTALPDSEEKKQQRNKTIKYLEENGVEAFIKPFVPPLFAPANRKRCDGDINKLIKTGLSTSIESIKNTTAAMRDRPDRTHVLSEAEYPVLFIIGKKDTTVKLEDILTQCHLPSESYVQFLGDTAHQGIFEKPQETLQMIHSFVRIVFG